MPIVTVLYSLPSLSITAVDVSSVFLQLLRRININPDTINTDIQILFFVFMSILNNRVNYLICSHFFLFVFRTSQSTHLNILNIKTKKFNVYYTILLICLITFLLRAISFFRYSINKNPITQELAQIDRINLNLIRPPEHL